VALAYFALLEVSRRYSLKTREWPCTVVFLETMALKLHDDQSRQGLPFPRCSSFWHVLVAQSRWFNQSWPLIRRIVLTMPTPSVLLFSQQLRTGFAPQILLNLSVIVARSPDFARKRRTNSAREPNSETPSCTIASLFAHWDPRCGVPRNATPLVVLKM
jgi:hypothetical protein